MQTGIEANTGNGGLREPASMITQTQVGAIGEAAVATQLALASDGRLSPFLPFADDDGIDLLVFDKVSRRATPVQVKSRTVAALGKSDTVAFDVRRQTFNARPDAFLIASLLDLSDASIRCAWLIPMAELPSIARTTKDKLSITPSAKATSKDRYAIYRCTEMAEVADGLIGYLSGGFR